MGNPDRFLSFAEVAELIGLDEGTVRNGEAETNTIPRIKLGKRVLFSFNAVQEWMAAKAREAEERLSRSQARVTDLASARASRQRAVNRTLQTILNGGKYK